MRTPETNYWGSHPQEDNAPMLKLPPMSDPAHDKVRGALRLFGPTVVVAGIVMTAVGLVSFFSAFGTFQPPRYFWAAMVGLPLIGVGLAMSQIGYVRDFARYFLKEGAPVVRETYNTMADATNQAVETMAQAVGRGLSSGMGSGVPSGSGTIPCHRCDAPNPPAAKFCNQCGAALAHTACPECGARLAPTARFCNQCGKPVG
jgi:ribosomal protein L40E